MKLASKAATLLTAAVALLLLPFAATAEDTQKPATTDPLLWVIEGETPSYLFGTIHISSPEILDFPESVRTAFSNADVLYTEIPMDMLSMGKMAASVIATPEESFGAVAPPAVRERVAKFAERKGGDASTFDGMKVWIVGVQLATMGHTEMMAKNPAVDIKLYADAALKGKKLRALETIDSQVSVFERFTPQEQIELLEDSLDTLEEDLDAGRDSLLDQQAMYVEGDLEKMWAEAMDQYDETDELSKRMVDGLIHDRDKAMAAKAAEYLRAEPNRSHFFAVGTLHFAGPYGIQKELAKMGFKVRRVKAGESLPARVKDAAKP